MIKRFLSYVEITTKITSVFTFALCMVYLYYLGHPAHPGLSALFFGSMFLFDLTTTAINNYIDTKTNGIPLQFSRKTGMMIIVVLFTLSAGLGITLAVLTDVNVLLLGGLCFLCGVAYTAGPVPISRQPLGELFSGVFYGVMIPLILIYVNLPAGELFTLRFSARSVDFSLNLSAAVPFALICAAPACATANIMLANNICDVEKDVRVGRFTLAYYLKRHALTLFAALYVLPYLASVLLVVLGYLPVVYLLSLVTAPVVFRNVRAFFAKQEKRETFVLSVQNFIMLMSGHIIALAAAAIL